MALSRGRVGAWDNSTRGLDAASALQFVKSLRLSADLGKSCHAVAAYQASQMMYDLFDTVIVLYEGQEIFFGRYDRAVQYFEDMGWECPRRQVSGDFLTSITNPGERKAREGMEDKVPRSAAEFEAYWKKSPEYQELQKQIAIYEEENPMDGEGVKQFAASKQAQQW
jgi:ATP-binding cassette subfamily G (WHITE) protein 2 (PDR)